MDEFALGQPPPTAGRRGWATPLVYGAVLALLALVAWGLVRAQAGPREAGPASDLNLLADLERGRRLLEHAAQ